MATGSALGGPRRSARSSKSVPPVSGRWWRVGAAYNGWSLVAARRHALRVGAADHEPVAARAPACGLAACALVVAGLSPGVHASRAAIGDLPPSRPQP